jgi:hypothetical protein
MPLIALGRQARREALGLGNPFDLDRDCVHGRLDAR